MRQPSFVWQVCASLLLTSSLVAQDDLAEIRKELSELKQRVTALESENNQLKRQIEVDRLIVRQELIVSDTGQPWEAGFESHQMPRGIYAKSLGDGPGGLWVRSRLIKGEIDDPFDDRFHAIDSNHQIRRAPGHISWNVWLDGAWRQMAIIQGEGLETNSTSPESWNGGNHPGQLRFQTFRPYHEEPLTDVLMGQGKMSIGGGGYGGGGLPFPDEVLQLWGGELRQVTVARPGQPKIVAHDGSREYLYALVALGPQGQQSPESIAVRAGGLATLQWDSVPGADAYLVVRDGEVISPPIRVEGAQKQWVDSGEP